MPSPSLDQHEKLGYLETTGRISGQPRETEIWWAQDGARIFLLSGGGLAKDWIRNLQQTPEVRFRVHDVQVRGIASIVSNAHTATQARTALARKYHGYDPERDDELPNDWTRTATPVMIVLD